MKDDDCSWFDVVRHWVNHPDKTVFTSKTLADASRRMRTLNGSVQFPNVQEPGFYLVHRRLRYSPSTLQNLATVEGRLRTALERLDSLERCLRHDGLLTTAQHIRNAQTSVAHVHETVHQKRLGWFRLLP